MLLPVSDAGLLPAGKANMLHPGRPPRPEGGVSAASPIHPCCCRSTWGEAQVSQPCLKGQVRECRQLSSFPRERQAILNKLSNTV